MQTESTEGKVCPGCPEKGEQPRAAFHKAARRYDGLQSVCKVCRRGIAERHLATGQHAAWNRAYQRRLRDAMHAAYGEICACCGEAERVFLTLDHIDGFDDEHRDPGHRSGRKNSNAIIRLLRDAGWPPGYQILCWNCNAAKGILGVCPHQTARLAAAA